MFVFRSTVTCFVLGILVAQLSWADERIFEVYSAGGTQQLVYEVVPKKKGEQGAGIYRVNPETDASELIVSGEVLGASRAFNGIVAQLRITSVTFQDEAMAIVNGRLILFSKKSDPKNPSSIISIGSSQMPVVDPFSHQEFRIQDIENKNDASVVSGRTNGGEVVLVSLRQANPFGPGVTFAFMVKNTGGSEELTLTGRPVVINYEFLSPAKLATLGQTDGFAQGKIFSHLLLKSLAQPRPNDAVGIVKWRRHLAEFVSILPATEKDGASIGGFPVANIPLLNLNDGSIALDSLPMSLLTRRGEPLAAIQVEDPVNNRHYMYVMHPTDLEVPSRLKSYAARNEPDSINGKVEMRSDGKETFLFQSKANLMSGPMMPNNLFGLTTRSSGTQSNSLIMKADGRILLYFLAPGERVLQHVDVTQLLRESLQGDVHNLSFVHMVYDNGVSRGDDHFLVISIQGEKSSRTVAVGFEFDEPRSARDGNVIVFGNTFYTQAELEKRIAASSNTLFFDAHSKIENITRDGITPAPLTPMLDVRDGEEVNLTAKEKKVLHGTQLEWMEFERDSGVINPSGIYREDSDAKEWKDKKALVKRGQLIVRAADISSSDLTTVMPIESKRIAFGKEGNDRTKDNNEQKVADLSLFAVEALHGGDFEILLNVHAPYAKNLSSKDEQLFVPFKDGTVFDQIVEAKFVRNRNLNDDVVTLVILAKEIRDGDQVVKQGGVHVTSFRVVQVSENREALRYSLKPVGDSAWITRQAVEPTLLRSHIIFDRAGRPLWIDHPTMDRNDPQFTVVQTHLGSKGRSNLRSLTDKALFNETLDEDETKGWARSDWQLTHLDQFEKTFQFLKNAAATRGEEKDRKKREQAERKELKNLFPNLTEFFKRFADSKHQPQHEIVLIESNLRESFFRAISVEYSDSATAFGWNNRAFSLYLYDNEDTLPTVTRELRSIASATNAKLLLVDGGKIGRRATPASSNETQKSLQIDGAPTPAASVSAETANGDEEVPLIRLIAAEGDPALADDPRQLASMRATIPMTIVMTPSELRTLQENFPEEFNMYFKDNFKIRTDMLTASWSLLSPTSARASESVKTAAKEGVSEDAVKVFPDLSQILTEAATPGASKRHKIIIFPDDQKGLINRLVLGRWVSPLRQLSDPSLPNGKWNVNNPNLSLIKLPTAGEKKVTQDMIFENYAAVEQIQKSRQAVVIGDLADVLAMGRPDSSEHQDPFMIHDPSAEESRDGALGGTSASQNGEVAAETLPHALWLVASEGQRVQANLRQGWTLESSVPHHIPTILYGTRSEYEKLLGELSFEKRLIDIEKEFEIVELQEPPVDVRRGLLNQVLTERTQVKSLGLMFQAGDNGRAKSDPADVVSVLVARVEQVAKSLKQNPTSAFIRVYSDLQAFIAQDPTVRKTRLVDKAALERLLSRVFPIGLKIESLPSDDPLQKVKDPVKAGILWTAAGFRGYSDLKRRMAEMTFSQTESGRDDSRPMPNSAIISGPTSTGKTYLVVTEAEMLGQEPFDRRNPTKPGGYFLVKVQEIFDDAKEGASSADDKERLTVSKMMALMEQFLFLNDRGTLIFDDLHKAQSTDILKKLMTFISSMLEAPKGMFRVRNISGETRDIPIRNAGLRITVNPTPDKKMRERFEGLSPLERDILAGLSRDDYVIEPSFLARIANKFDMNRFPAGAMVSSIISRVREAATTEFATRQALVLSSPHAIARLAKHFDGAHAREILSPATAALMEFPRDLPNAPVILIDLKNTEKTKLMSDNGGISAAEVGGGDQIDRDVIRSAIRDSLVYRAVDGQNVASMLDFMGSMVDSFRIHAYQSLVEGMQESTFLNDSVEKRTFFLSEMLLSVFDQLTHWNTVPLNNVPVYPQEFGWTSQGKMSEFGEALRERSENPRNQVPFFFFNFSAQPSGGSLTLTTEDSGDRQVLSVLSETSWKLRRVLIKLMAAYFRVRDINQMPEARQWVSEVRSIPLDPKKADTYPDGVYFDPAMINEVGREISDIYLDFVSAIFDHDLLEYKNASEHSAPRVQIGKYDQARLFLQAFDKAVVSLPWPKVTKLVYEGLKAATADHQLGYLPQFQDYMFNSAFSPFDTTTPDTVFQSVTGHPNYKVMKDFDHDRRRSRFDNNCRNMLLPGNEAER